MGANTSKVVGANIIPQMQTLRAASCGYLTCGLNKIRISYQAIASSRRIDLASKKEKKETRCIGRRFGFGCGPGHVPRRAVSSRDHVSAS